MLPYVAEEMPEKYDFSKFKQLSRVADAAGLGKPGGDW